MFFLPSATPGHLNRTASITKAIMNAFCACCVTDESTDGLHVETYYIHSDCGQFAGRLLKAANAKPEAAWKFLHAKLDYWNIWTVTALQAHAKTCVHETKNHCR